MISKKWIRDQVDKKVGSDVYQKVEEKVKVLLQEAEERAEKNDRKTVQGKDL